MFVQAVVSLMAPADAAAQNGESYPSFGSGDAVRADVCVKLQGDWRDFREPFDLHRARIGLEGTLLTRVDYQIERE